MRSKRLILAAGLFVLAGIAAASIPQGMAASDETNRQGEASRRMLTSELNKLLSSDPSERSASVRWFVERGNQDAIPALIQVLRFVHSERAEIVSALRQLSGDNKRSDWFEWMLWQQEQKDLIPVNGFDAFKADAMARIDPNFRVFLYPGIDHKIRLEEITWGGVTKDGIPALNNPELLPGDSADYLTDDELVFGVAINGDVRAYPLRIMDWHEMFNDVIGGVPVSLAYCTLCGSGILFETTVNGRNKPFVFGSSGFLYRFNKLMYDTETHSLWNQFTGRPVVGKLTGSGIELKTRPVVITSWKNWRMRHPATKVLSLETGHARDYRPGKPYGTYFASADLMFPVRVDTSKLKAKDFVFALRSSGPKKAWPLSLFESNPVVNDTAGVLELTLVGDPRTRTVRAYRTKGQTFAKGPTTETLSHKGETWRITEDALVSPSGDKLHRLPGHVAYWFAWSGYYGDTGELASPTN